MQNSIIRKLIPSDAAFLLDILNYYALNTTSDFSDKPHDLADVKKILGEGDQLPKYVIEVEGEIIGFGLAYYFRPEQTFSGTVKFTYWIKPDFTGHGWGTQLYHFIEKECKQNGIANILVNISSENIGSIKFHERLGFVHCGHFNQIGNKFGKSFDMIWLQKTLSD